MRNLKGPLMLLGTAALWGLTFAAQTTAADNVSPFTFNACRNFVGVLFLTAVIAVRKQTGSDLAPVKTSTMAPGGADSGSSQSGSSLQHRQLGTYTTRVLIVGGTVCGLVLFLASYLQQSGISAYPADAAASGRSGFVTANYMVMVALYTVIAGRKSHPLVFASVAVALLGMYLLCVPNGFDSIYLGDILCFVGAFFWAAHIAVIDRYTLVDGVRLSRMQLLVSGGVSLVCALIFEQPDPAAIAAALVPILYAGICSDGIAYTLQIVAQKTTDATVASIIMSLESVFAGLGGWIILGERLGAVELCGCALVFAAVLLAQVPTFIENAKAKQESA